MSTPLDLVCDNACMNNGLPDALRRALPCNILDCPNIGTRYTEHFYENDEWFCEMHAPEGALEDPDRTLISRVASLPELASMSLETLDAEELDSAAPWNDVSG